MRVCGNKHGDEDSDSGDDRMMMRTVDVSSLLSLLLSGLVPCLGYAFFLLASFACLVLHFFLSFFLTNISENRKDVPWRPRRQTAWTHETSFRLT